MELTITVISLFIAIASVTFTFIMMSRTQKEREKNSIYLEERLTELARSLNKEMETRVKLSAHESLQATSSSLRETNLEQINAILEPLKVKIDEFHRSVSISNTQSAASRKSLNDSMERLMKMNMSIGEEARNLAMALKGNSKVQGEWGETVLTGLLEEAGLTKGIHFDCQLTKDETGSTLINETGNRLRPDVIVRLPEGNSIIIDSKVPLKAYLEYCEATTPGEEATALHRHIAAVKRTIDRLASKEYHRILKSSADYVIMFIPNDGAYIAALRSDSDLAGYAFDKKVILASSPHLLSIIQLTARMWRQHKQETNAAEIARLGGLLYDKMAAFTKDMEGIENHLSQAMNSYRNAFSKLAEGRQSIVARAERLRSMGVKTNTRIPSSFTSETSDPGNTEE